MGQPELRSVPFSLPAPGPSIELTGLRDIIRRGGPSEFLSMQRLGFEMLYVIESGSTVHEVDFVSHELGQGDAIWVRAGQVHRWGDISTLTGRVALFPPHAIPPTVQEVLIQMGFRGSTPPTTSWAAPRVRASGAALAWQALHGDDMHFTDVAARSLVRGVALSAVLLRLATGSLRSVMKQDFSSAPPAEGAVFAALVDEVDAQFHRLHSVSEYADKLGWSVKALGRAAAFHGTTPKRVIDDRVVLEAKRMLVHTNRTVASIAETVGYDDPSNFSSFFRHRTGATPGLFRARAV